MMVLVGVIDSKHDAYFWEEGGSSLACEVRVDVEDEFVRPFFGANSGSEQRLQSAVLIGMATAGQDGGAGRLEPIKGDANARCGNASSGIQNMGRDGTHGDTFSSGS